MQEFIVKDEVCVCFYLLLVSPASLQKGSGSTQVPVCTWNNT
jgi:hypothetical protein